MTTNNATNSPFPLSATQGGLGLSDPTAHGILIAEGSSAATPIVLTAGQLLIGTTSSDPVGATLTAGTGISITSVTGSITIAATGGTGVTWNAASASTQAMVAGNGYYQTFAGTVAFTLPSTAAAGTELFIAGSHTEQWTLAQNASQNITFGNQVTSTGTGGSLASSEVGDGVHLVCSVANTTWVVIGVVGNITYV